MARPSTIARIVDAWVNSDDMPEQLTLRLESYVQELVNDAVRKRLRRAHAQHAAELKHAAEIAARAALQTYRQEMESYEQRQRHPEPGTDRQSDRAGDGELDDIDIDIDIDIDFDADTDTADRFSTAADPNDGAGAGNGGSVANARRNAVVVDSADAADGEPNDGAPAAA